MYINLSITEFPGPSRKFVFYASFSENLWFQTIRFTGLLELVQLYKQNQLDKIFIFTIYQNYTLDLTRETLAKHDFPIEFVCTAPPPQPPSPFVILSRTLLQPIMSQQPNVKTSNNVTKLRHYALTIQLIMSQRPILSSCTF